MRLLRPCLYTLFCKHVFSSVGSPSRSEITRCVFNFIRNSQFSTVVIPAQASQVVLVVKNNQCGNAGDIRDTASIPGLGRSPGGGHGSILLNTFYFFHMASILQYSCLENPMDRGAWWATVHGVAKSWTQMKQLNTHNTHESYSSSASLLTFAVVCLYFGSFPGSSAGKESACSAGYPSLIPGPGGSPREGIGYPLQYCWASLVAQMVKNPSAVWETWV